MTEGDAETPGKLGVVELFAGIGSVARGFAATGRFSPLLLTDVDKTARDTFVENFPEGPGYLRTDVRELTADTVLRSIDGAPISGLLGCPPCQGFSPVGRRNLADPNNSLLVDFFNFAVKLNVDFFVMENVPAVMSQNLFKLQLRRIRRRFRVWAGTLNAALYGLPQTRQRCIVIGYRRDLGVVPTAPPATHFGQRAVFDYATGAAVVPSDDSMERLLGTYPGIGLNRRAQARLKPRLPEGGATLADLITIGDAIGDLPLAGCRDGFRVRDRSTSSYALALCAPEHEVYNHTPWGHGLELVQRMAGIPEGGAADPESTKRYYSQAYARLHRRGLARTVTTNFHNPGSGRFTHYRAHRTLTVREAARLQGIPDSFRFIGHQSWQERLVGNAFPQRWAQVIARHVWAQVGPALSAD